MEVYDDEDDEEEEEEIIWEGNEGMQSHNVGLQIYMEEKSQIASA